jgi:para-aminobenzoate synthetase/4-amino-4-deoxychorismate lyase
MNFKTQNNVILHDAQSKHWLRFHSPKQVIETKNVIEVAAGLSYIENEVNERGLYAAGFLSYEAAPAFDQAFVVNKHPKPFPLLWFGLYRKPDRIAAPKPPAVSRYRIQNWRPSTGFAKYKRNIEEIKKCIARGETYQVNYTLRFSSPFSGNAWDFFRDLNASQQADYSAFVDFGRYAICSASPELFFTLNKNRLVSRPMKGTAARGLFLKQDNEQLRWLASSEKNRAENIMIVDMVRNDMGRVADPASVSVPRLCECERFPTVWQMTSGVQCATGRPVADIMAALFPCASITGAPKVSTMGIIRRLEKSDRGIYTGCIGYIAPGRRAQFNVAIRTAIIDKQTNKATYGAGGGIVWQSDPAAEYGECCLKAAVLTRRFPLFSLVETMLWTPQKGYFLLGRHLGRLRGSASYFGFGIDMRRVHSHLDRLARSLPLRPHRVRLLIDKSGMIACKAAPLCAPEKSAIIRLALARRPVDSTDCFLYHKTTHRDVYEQARAERTGFDDVLLYNEREEITESCIANVAVLLDNRLITPPQTCGLLGGTMRAHCLAKHSMCEGVIRRGDLSRAEAIYTINSVRKWRKAVIAAD